MRRAAVAAPLAILMIVGGCKEAPKAFAAKAPAVCDSVPDIAMAGHVTDAANALSDGEEARLSERLARYERLTRHQMVVATTPGLNGVDVADFGDCLGNRWGIGDKNQNDGILILVAPNDRRARISTGTGMEVMLTDEEANGVMTRMLPYFKAADYAGGLSAGIDAIAAETGEEQ